MFRMQMWELKGSGAFEFLSAASYMLTFKIF